MIINKILKIEDINIYGSGSDFYISLSLLVKCNDGSIFRIIYPKIKFPIKLSNIEFENTIDSTQRIFYKCCETKSYINLGFDKFEILKDESGRGMYIECVKKSSPKKMTLKDIERNLGYKIELVSEE